MKALFFIEAEVDGAQIMGHASFIRAVESGLRDRDDLHVRFAGFPPAGRFARRLTEGAPWLSRFDADLQQTRWHLVNSLRARRVVLEELERGQTDVVGCLSHAVGLALARPVHPRPLVLMADVAMWDWRQMAIWRRLRPWSRRFLAGSLAMERRALNGAALVVAWSEWSGRTIGRSAPRAKTVVIHPGLDLQLYRPAAARDPRARPRVLFVGGRFAEKGGYDLIAALGPMLGREVDLELITPERVPERDGVTRLALSPGPDLAERFRQADLVALPTYGDAVPWVVLEALASGTPVVASPVGAIPELLDDGRLGGLVPVGDRAALRGTVIQLLEDDRRRVELGQAGRQKAERAYDARRQSELLFEHLAPLVNPAP